MATEPARSEGRTSRRNGPAAGCATLGSPSPTMRRHLAVCSLLPLLTMAPPARAQDPAAVRATLEAIDRIRKEAAGTEAAELAKVGGAASCAPSDYRRIVLAAQQQAAARLDDLLQRTGDPAAKAEVFLAFLRYPEQRPARESLQDALVVAPAGRCRARVLKELAELTVDDEPERSLALLERAAAEDPAWAEPVQRRAWVSAWAGRHAQALADLDEAERREPAAKGGLTIVRVRFLMLAGEFDRAVDTARALRTAPGAAPTLVEPAALLEAAALLALDSRPEAALVLRPFLGRVDSYGSLFDFQADAVKSRFRDLVAELEAAQRRAEAARPARPAPTKPGDPEPARPLGIDRESDEERNAREAEELRVAEAARAKARALREAARPRPEWIDTPCPACGGDGAAVLKCPHCDGRGTELYRTRKYTEREQQGPNWVVRTREVRLPCGVCDGAGVVGGKCPECHGKGSVSIRNPNR